MNQVEIYKELRSLKSSEFTPYWIFVQFDARFHQFHLWTKTEVFKLQEEHKTLLCRVEKIGMSNATSCFCTQHLYNTLKMYLFV